MTKLQYTCLNDWYNVTLEDIVKNGGGGLLNGYYNGSPSKALLNAYPEHIWHFWKFSVPHYPWEKSQKNQREFFDWLFTKLGYKQMDDWYNVTQEDIFNNYGRRLLNVYYSGNPSHALKAVYPTHNWEKF